MSKLILFPSHIEREKYIFKNLPVKVNRGDEFVEFPCITLCCKGTVDIPIWHPLFERWYLSTDKVSVIASPTLRKRSSAVCTFLNYILHETTRSCIHDITLNEIRLFLISYKTKDDGEERSGRGWDEGVSFVYDFLANYYMHHKDVLAFSYRYEDLITREAFRSEKNGRMIVVNRYNHLSVRAPKQLTKKNRLLLYGYLDLILLECEMYDPELTLAVALQAYAGLREGEVVNLSYNRIKLQYAGFGCIGDISINLTSPASFARTKGKTEFGNIKVFRMQKVYPDFNDRILKLYNAHVQRHHEMHCDTTGETAIFLNSRKKPMSVHTYKRRVKQLFFDHFLPDLKKVSEQNGTWAIDAPYIEAYEEDYPGAHAFRHWFTMYLLQKAKLPTDLISKWRGDSSRESMLTYIHINSDMLESFETAAHTFQRSWLEEIL